MIQCFVVLAGLVFFVLMMKEPEAQQSHPDPFSIPSTTAQSDGGNLEARVLALERAMQRQDLDTVAQLKSKVDQLEEQVADIARNSNDAPAGNPADEIARLRRDNQSLERTVSNLKSEQSKLKRSSSDAPREISQLRNQIRSLENAVGRLQSRR